MVVFEQFVVTNCKNSFQKLGWLITLNFQREERHPGHRLKVENMWTKRGKHKSQKKQHISVIVAKRVQLKYCQSTDEVQTNYRLSTDYEVKDKT